MIAVPNIASRWYSVRRPLAIFAAGYLVLMVISMQNYLRFTAAFWLGILALPLVLQVYTGNSKSYRYLPIVFIAGLLCWVMPVKTLLYFTICFALVLLWETWYGKTGILVPAIVLLISPAFRYLVNTFSFPLRLQLTKAAGYIFQWMGYETRTEGNVIIRNNNEFSVDPACMGLSMITTSLLFGIILISFYQRKSGRRINIWGILLFMTAILFLNILANLLRIILLVFFDIPAGTISHDIAGVVCLLLYVLLPATWLASLFAGKFPLRKISEGPGKQHSIVRCHFLFHFVMFGMIVLLTCKVIRAPSLDQFHIPAREEVKDYLLTMPAPGIVKLGNKETLIYIKYIRGFYDTDHNPMMCWTGSGYRFEKVMEDNIDKYQVFTATLVSGKDKLYTAWWYDNGNNQTINQFNWRMDLLKGSPGYALVNVTCSDTKKLKEETRKILDQKKLAMFFKQ